MTAVIVDTDTELFIECAAFDFALKWLVWFVYVSKAKGQ